MTSHVRPLARKTSIEVVIDASNASATTKGTPLDPWPENKLSNRGKSQNARLCPRVAGPIRSQFGDLEHAAKDTGW
jgi:hypothetical protein